MTSQLVAPSRHVPMKRSLRMDMGRPLVDRAKLTGLLIEEFIRSRRYVPDEASPIWALDDLPFDVDGALVACADWLRRADGRWVLYRILEPAHLQSSQPEQTEAI